MHGFRMGKNNNIFLTTDFTVIMDLVLGSLKLDELLQHTNLSIDLSRPMYISRLGALWFVKNIWK